MRLTGPELDERWVGIALAKSKAASGKCEDNNDKTLLQEGPKEVMGMSHCMIGTVHASLVFPSGFFFFGVSFFSSSFPFAVLGVNIFHPTDRLHAHESVFKVLMGVKAVGRLGNVHL